MKILLDELLHTSTDYYRFLTRTNKKTADQYLRKSCGPAIEELKKFGVTYDDFKTHVGNVTGGLVRISEDSFFVGVRDMFEAGSTEEES